MSQDVHDFIYVNGGLFEEAISIAECDTRMRQCLLDASKFNWSRISPAIFGSMFQNALTPANRRKLGAHYTSEQNILRTIRPLFLDELETQLTACGIDVRRLRRFRDELGNLTFFDPACGCGNFLVIAYREVRRIELKCLILIREAESRRRDRRDIAGTGQIALDVSWESVVHVGQFYGIEIEEWPCRIAETAMHLTDHLANQELSAVLRATITNDLPSPRPPISVMRMLCASTGTMSYRLVNVHFYLVIPLLQGRRPERPTKQQT